MLSTRICLQLVIIVVIVIEAAIVFSVGGIFLLFVLLLSRKVARQSHETFPELLHCPFRLRKVRILLILKLYELF